MIDLLALTTSRMAGWLLVEATLVLLVLALHPFTFYPLSLRVLALLRPRPLRPRAPRHWRVALCVCAYNEATVIRARVSNMLAMQETMPELELLVYVDGATDGTAAILDDLARQHPGRLRVVAEPRRHGKTHGMNTLVGLTNADIVVFSDANVAFDSEAIPNLVEPFADPEVGAVCGHLVYTRADGVTAATGSLYWRIEERIKALESATGSVIGADGSIFAIRRCLHRPPPPDLIDDMYVSLSVLCDGARVVRAKDAIAYEAPVTRRGEDFGRRIRIACQAFNVHRAMRGQLHHVSLLDKYKYISHKFLRWLTGYLLAGGVLCGAAGLGLLLVTGGQAVLYVILLAAALGLGLAVLRARRGRLAAVHDILGAFLASGIGVARSLRGDHFQTWAPPASTRTRERAREQV